MQPQGTPRTQTQPRRLRHDGHLPHHLPALPFIPLTARRLAAPPVHQAGNFPGAEPAPVLVAERRDRTETPIPAPIPALIPIPAAAPPWGARQVSSERCGALPPSRTGALPGAPGSYRAAGSRRLREGTRAGGICRDRGCALPVSGRFSGSRAARVVGVRARRGPGPRRPPGVCPGAAPCRGDRAVPQFPLSRPGRGCRRPPGGQADSVSVCPGGARAGRRRVRVEVPQPPGRC